MQAHRRGRRIRPLRPRGAPCVFENGEPFVRKTYLICQKEALALPQGNAFVELLKKYR